jgi:hypothetical protein
MKRWTTIILTAILLLSSLTIPVFAAGNGYTDADEDGICDHRSSNLSFVDADGDGICDNRKDTHGQGYGLCRRSDNGTIFPCGRKEHRPRGQRNGICSEEHFIDENHDGICDHRTQAQKNFTDEDGDGICGNRGQGKGNGQGRQRGKNK